MCILSEQMMSLADAAAMLPRRRAGKKVHLATVYRWTQVGCRGVRLESLQIGATRCTSVEAMQRFFVKLSAPNGPVQTAAGPAAISPLSRRQVNQELDREGL